MRVLRVCREATVRLTAAARSIACANSHATTAARVSAGNEKHEGRHVTLTDHPCYTMRHDHGHDPLACWYIRIMIAYDCMIIRVHMKTKVVLPDVFSKLIVCTITGSGTMCLCTGM